MNRPQNGVRKCQANGGKSRFFNFKPVVESKYKEQTCVSEDKEHKYYSVQGRWDGCLAMEAYFKSREHEASSTMEKNLIKKFSKDNRLALYSQFVHAIRKENSYVANDFRLGAVRYEFRIFLRTLIGLNLRKIRRIMESLRVLSKKLNKFKIL